MQKCIFFVPDAHESCIKVGREFFYFTDKQIANYKVAFVFLFMQLKKPSVFQKGDFRPFIFM